MHIQIRQVTDIEYARRAHTVPHLGKPAGSTVTVAVLACLDLSAGTVTESDEDVDILQAFSR